MKNEQPREMSKIISEGAALKQIIVAAENELLKTDNPSTKDIDMLLADIDEATARREAGIQEGNERMNINRSRRQADALGRVALVPDPETYQPVDQSVIAEHNKKVADGAIDPKR